MHGHKSVYTVMCKWYYNFIINWEIKMPTPMILVNVREEHVYNAIVLPELYFVFKIKN